MKINKADVDIDAAYASVYDVIYGGDQAFLAAQIAFLVRFFPQTGLPLLDAGCGAGRHLLPLLALGHDVTGLDNSLTMLRVARHHLVEQGLNGTLVGGDLRALPFWDAFGGILCLDSPLALLPGDEELDHALLGFRRALKPGGILVAEIFDYPGTLGKTDFPPRRTRFCAPGVRVDVKESHSYDFKRGIWEMRQVFFTRRGRRHEHFAVTHRLRIRSADVYAAALEAAGFRIQELLTRYPETPADNQDEQRLIFIARC